MSKVESKAHAVTCVLFDDSKVVLTSSVSVVLCHLQCSMQHPDVSLADFAMPYMCAKA